jgi:hypothetical protein
MISIEVLGEAPVLGAEAKAVRNMFMKSGAAAEYAAGCIHLDHLASTGRCACCSAADQQVRQTKGIADDIG